MKIKLTLVQFKNYNIVPFIKFTKILQVVDFSPKPRTSGIPIVQLESLLRQDAVNVI